MNKNYTEPLRKYDDEIPCVNAVIVAYYGDKAIYVTDDSFIGYLEDADETTLQIGENPVLYKNNRHSIGELGVEDIENIHVLLENTPYVKLTDID